MNFRECNECESVKKRKNKTDLGSLISTIRKQKDHRNNIVYLLSQVII